MLAELRTASVSIMMLLGDADLGARPCVRAIGISMGAGSIYCKLKVFV